MDIGRSFWFVAGLGCGTVVGMLYAPLAGVRTRAIAIVKAKEAQRFWEHSGQRQTGDASESATHLAAAPPDARERIRRTLDAARGTRRP